MQHLRVSIDSPGGVQQHAYMPKHKHKLQTKMALWKHPGTDINGTLARIERIAGTAEKVSKRLIKIILS